MPQPGEAAGVAFPLLMFLSVFCSLSSGHEQRQKKKLDILTEKVKFAPKNLTPLISRRDQHLLSPLTSFLTYLMLEGIGGGEGC